MSEAGDFLSAMGRAAEARARALAGEPGSAALERDAGSAPPPPRLALSAQGFDIIAEIKLNSPSAGVLSSDPASIEDRARAYGAAGACAVSVLTEPARFGGSLDHLRRAARALAPGGVPVMAKDFIVAPEQVWAARAAGAGGVLLILRMLDDARLASLLALTLELGMFVLLEAFDAADLARAGDITRPAGAADGGLLLGLNCRDLRTLAVDPARFASLSPRFPDGFPRVAESGIETPADAARAAADGYSVALVGTALMRSADPAALLEGLLRAGRGRNPGER